MREFKHWPLAIAASAIVGSQVLCAWWITSNANDNYPESYAGALGDIGSAADKAAYNTARIDLEVQAIRRIVSEEIDRQARQDIIDRLNRSR